MPGVSTVFGEGLRSLIASSIYNALSVDAVKVVVLLIGPRLATSCQVVTAWMGD